MARWNYNEPSLKSDQRQSSPFNVWPLIEVQYGELGKRYLASITVDLRTNFLNERLEDL